MSKAEIEKKLKDGIVSFSFKGIKTYIHENGEIKKKAVGLPDWKEINSSNCLTYDKGTAHAILTGEISNLTVLDFDDKDGYDNFILQNEDLKRRKTIKTKKGFHIYFKYNPEFKTGTDAFKDIKNVDIRNDGGIVYCNPTQYKMPNGDIVKYEDLGGEIEEIPSHILNYLKEEKKVKKEKKKISIIKMNNTVNNISKNEEIEELLNYGLLDCMAFKSYDEWRNVGLCMRYTTTKEHFIRFSKINMDKYDEHETLDFWYSIKENYDGSNVGTLKSYIYENDKENYDKFFNFYLSIEALNKGAFEVAKAIYNKLKCNLKFSSEYWWMFNKDENLWVQTKEPAFNIIQIIHKHLDYSIKSITNKICNTTDEEEKKRLIDINISYNKFYSIVDKPGFYSQIKKHLESLLNDKEFYSLLDNNKYEVAFKNGIYDLKKNEFIEGLKQHNFLTKKINFNYEKPSKEDIEEVRNILFKINNCNEEHLEYYLGVLGQAITGDAEKEKALYFCIGTSGNNGKTLILEALSEIMECYVGKIDRKTFEIGYSKSHKHLTGTKGKRIVYIEELSTKEQNIELLKEIGDGKNIKNEVMFGTDEKINIMFKLIFLSNCEANLKIDGGIKNRYRQITLNSNFDKENDIDDYENKRFIQDTTLSDKLKGNLKNALIYLILQAGAKYTKEKKLVIPRDYEDDINETIDNNDYIKLWFNENIEYGENFRIGKAELSKQLEKPFQHIQKDIERITRIKYKKDIRINGVKGGFVGFRIKIIDDFSDTDD